jgi:uncharacterized RDD family membrane protein YckC
MASSTDYNVLTPERVSLHYDVAGIGSRSAAALVDALVQLVLFVALVIASTATAFLEPVRFVNDAAPWLGWVVLAIGSFLVLLGYHLLFELAWSGQTPGKRLLGIRVIRENGYPIRPVDATVRNLIRVVDGPPFAFVIGIVVMLLNDRAKRLGDFAAGTIVVREARRQGLSTFQNLALGTAAAPDGAQEGAQAGVPLPSLGAEDTTLVRDFLVRRHSMAGPARAALARRLAGAVAVRYGITAQRPGDGADEAFLERLVGAES